MGAQNTQIWTARLWIAIELTSAQIGGYCALRTDLHRLRHLRSVTACGR
jgi:hypothetical protein